MTCHHAPFVHDHDICNVCRVVGELDRLRAQVAGLQAALDTRRGCGSQRHASD